MEKMIRDKVPQAIEEDGRNANTRTATNDAEYVRFLREKLQEETAEFLESEEPLELADILEVLYALAQTKGLSPEELETLRAKKADQYGAFAKRIILKK